MKNYFCKPHGNIFKWLDFLSNSDRASATGGDEVTLSSFRRECLILVVTGGSPWRPLSSFRI